MKPAAADQPANHRLQQAIASLQAELLACAHQAVAELARGIASDVADRVALAAVPVLIDLAEVARLASVSEREASRWASARQIPGRRDLGGRRCVRYVRSSVVEWLSGREPPPESDASVQAAGPRMNGQHKVRQ